MKERPIIFSAPMVHAILEGRKTQTRRIYSVHNGQVWPKANDLPGLKQAARLCKFGQPGELLWVRETYAMPIGTSIRSEIAYRADMPVGGSICPPAGYPLSWKPPMHMPRWASRITLAVTDVRVERLQQISEADAIADGLMPWRGGYLYSLKEQWFKSPVDAFKQKWEAANKNAASWAANPWVWVIEFKRLEGQQ